MSLARNGMVVPIFSELVAVLVNVVEEQVMQQPQMMRVVRIETM
jgi:hypothetical protein